LKSIIEYYLFNANTLSKESLFALLIYLQRCFCDVTLLFRIDFCKRLFLFCKIKYFLLTSKFFVFARFLTTSFAWSTLLLLQDNNIFALFLTWKSSSFVNSFTKVCFDYCRLNILFALFRDCDNVLSLFSIFLSLMSNVISNNRSYRFEII